MNPFNLKNKTILVTGASSGIGEKTVNYLAKSGAKVILSARNKTRLEEIKSNLEGAGHQVIKADLTNEDELDKLVQQIDNIDGLVQSSGIVRPFPVKFIGKKQLNEMFGILFIN